MHNLRLSDAVISLEARTLAEQILNIANRVHAS